MADHHLKTWPGPFAEVRAGLKPFEFRVDDRGFQVGDRLFLEEWDPQTGEHTGEVEIRTVGYILAGGQFGIPPSYVVMAFLLSAAERDVAAERRRQVEVEGWTPEHDAEYRDGELARAAATYARAASLADFFRHRDKLKKEWENFHFSELRRLWPWDWEWWKPTSRRRDLVKAGALILAEIERLDRQAAHAVRAGAGDA